MLQADMRFDSPAAFTGLDTRERRGLSAGAVVPCALTAALVASLPALGVKFASDDITHRLMLEGKVPGYVGGWLGLYDFTPPAQPASAMIEQGMFPWFTDPNFSLRFLRPLSSATLGLDHALFGRNPMAAHAHGLLWMLVLAFAAGGLFRRWLAPPAAALAAIIFGLSGVHGIPVSWLASRHTLVAAAFGALSLWAWARYREDEHKPSVVWAVFALVASLLSSESGLVTVTLIAGYEVAARGLRAGLTRAALPIGIGVAYVLAYAALGYGARASTFYVSPFQNPVDYLVAAGLGVPALIAELLTGVPSIFAGLGGTTALIVVGAVGLAAAAGVYLLYRPLGAMVPAKQRTLLRGLALGAVVGSVALVGAPVSGRVLPLPALAAAAIMGQALWASWTLARGRASVTVSPLPRGHKRWWTATVVLALFQLVLSPCMRVIMAPNFNASADALEGIAREADVGACQRGGSIYVANGSDPTLTLYGAAALIFYTPEKAGAEHFRVLSMAPQAQRLSRLSPESVELEVLGEPRQLNPFENLFRGANSPLPLQTDLHLGELTARVEQANANLFTRVRFEFTGGIDPSKHCLLVWRDKRLQNVAWPTAGAPLEIAHERGLMGL
jgi:hypothetical protein